VSHRRRWRARDVSRWETARVTRTCRWCSESIIVGMLVLVVGPSQLPCCRGCANRFRGVTPPPEMVDGATDIDPRMRALPESDR